MLKTHLPVAKIVIDYEEYLELLKYKDIVKNQEKQFSSENVLECFTEPTFIKKVEFLKYFNLIPKVQFKKNSPNKTKKNIVVKTQNRQKEVLRKKKLKHSDNTLDHFLLKSISGQYQNRAKKLLTELHNNNNGLSWDKNGVICIDSVILPNSNIKILFPKLFKKVCKPDKVKYLNEVSSKIATLGLGSLLNRNLTNGLIRTKSIDNHYELSLKVNANQKWWYIGN
jgi:hypothetical protein